MYDDFYPSTVDLVPINPESVNFATLKSQQLTFKANCQTKAERSEGGGIDEAGEGRKELEEILTRPEWKF